MRVVGRFEILSPVLSGVVETSTARDPQTGETVLLHVLPPGHEKSPREYFLELAPGCPGKILDSGIDSETQCAFVVTDYPKDRKAVRLWIRELGGMAGPVKPAAPAAAPKPAPIAGPPPKPAADVQSGATRMLDPAAIFGNAAAAKPGEAPPPLVPASVKVSAAKQAIDPFAAFSAPAASAKPSAPPDAPPGGSATRMFDPSAVFGASAAASAKEAPAPVQDGATRMFDPSAVFGAPAAPKAKGKDAPPPSPEGGTRMFDPSAVFGAPAAAEAKQAPAVVEGATRMFDPSAVFGAPAAKPKVAPREEAPSDSSRKAADEFISGRLPAEFRSAPTKVQRSPEEFFGTKPHAGPIEVEPTSGRPGAITLLFDAYGRRTDNANGSTPAAPVDKPVPPGTAEESNSGATKMFSSSDLSGFFAAEPGAAEGGSSSIHSPGQDAKPEKNNPLPPQKGPSRNRK